MKKLIRELKNNSSFVILIFGWGTKLGMLKCKTTDITEFHNYEY